MTSTQRQQSTISILSERLRQELVTSLTQSGAIRSLSVRQAFLTVPREAFVPFFYVEDETSRKMVWLTVHADSTAPDEYLAKVYQNEPLVTKIDERGWPVSSSSQPSAMAKMLEALDVKPGQRVLEIGTGSGYNAALLTALTGNAHNVVTIEQDEILATQARQALKHVIGSEVKVVCGDGFPGWEQEAPYERILATASVSTLPYAWLEQLKLGGKLVMDLQGSLASGFLVGEKMADGFIGHFLAEPLHFMPLYTEALPATKVDIASISQQSCSSSILLEKNNPFPEKLFDSAFRWFLQWRICGCQVSMQKQVQRKTGLMIQSIFILDPKSKALMRLQQTAGEEIWHGEVYNSPHFWEDIQQTYEDFLSLNEPHQQEYQLVVEGKEPFLLIGSLKLSI